MKKERSDVLVTEIKHLLQSDVRKKLYQLSEKLQRREETKSPSRGK
jgi:hypothetical protein